MRRNAALVGIYFVMHARLAFSLCWVSVACFTHTLVCCCCDMDGGIFEDMETIWFGFLAPADKFDAVLWCAMCCDVHSSGRNGLAPPDRALYIVFLYMWCDAEMLVESKIYWNLLFDIEILFYLPPRAKGYLENTCAVCFQLNLLKKLITTSICLCSFLLLLAIRYSI